MDYIAANLPAINVEDTCDFYRMLGFQCLHQSKEWLILNRGSLSLEFFHHPELEPETSWHSACIRVQDLAALSCVAGFKLVCICTSTNHCYRTLN